MDTLPCTLSDVCIIVVTSTCTFLLLPDMTWPFPATLFQIRKSRLRSRSHLTPGMVANGKIISVMTPSQSLVMSGYRSNPPSWSNVVKLSHSS